MHKTFSQVVSIYWCVLSQGIHLPSCFNSVPKLIDRNSLDNDTPSDFFSCCICHIKEIPASVAQDFHQQNCSIFFYTFTKCS